ncbi:GDSL-type esterase/lipase family protein [Pontiella sp.]|uniref:GDSL-type esterase/lipase family protein n=1 Tax=Pontiella sp. TaxID=2837462 RepID=UPI00356B2D87
MKRSVAVALCLNAVLFLSSEGAEKSQCIKHMEAGDFQKIVAYGTELTANGAWVEQLQETLDLSYPGLARVINCGKAKMWSQWGDFNVKKQVISEEPDLVFIEFSMNDAVSKYRISIDQARKNLESIMDKILKANETCEIVMLIMNPPAGRQATLRPDLEAYNQMVRELAKARNTRVIDLYHAWNKLLEEDIRQFAQYVPDGLIPNEEGCRKFIIPALIENLGIRRVKTPEELMEEEKKMFKRMDTDGDQRVSEEEYIQVFADVFPQKDSDKDGTLSPIEYAHPSFQHADTDNDGKMTLQEYRAMYAEQFHTRDRQRDGSLTVEEMIAR